MIKIICGFACVCSYKLRNVSNVSDLPEKKQEKKRKRRRGKKRHW